MLTLLYAGIFPSECIYQTEGKVVFNHHNPPNVDMKPVYYGPEAILPSFYGPINEAIAIVSKLV